MRLSFLSKLFSGKSNEIEQPEQKSEDQSELVAVIAAAIQEYMNSNANPESRLEVVSIKRTGQTTPIWNRVGRLDHISRKL